MSKKYEIKPLKWEKFQSTGSFKGTAYMATNDFFSEFGEYIIHEEKEGGFYLSTPYDEGKVHKNIKTLEEAKAKLQKDWEKRLTKILKEVKE